jgi:hypothetical protein
MRTRNGCDTLHETIGKVGVVEVEGIRLHSVPFSLALTAFSRMAGKEKPRPADRAGLRGRRLTRRSSCGCATRSG